MHAFSEGSVNVDNVALCSDVKGKGTNMRLKYFVAISVLLINIQPAFAARCGTRLVTTGDHLAKVEHICGQPVSIQVSTMYRAGFSRHSGLRSVQSSEYSSGQELHIHDRSVIEVPVEEWIYNLGPGRFMRSIRFENGVVIKIKTLGYGY